MEIWHFQEGNPHSKNNNNSHGTCMLLDVIIAGCAIILNHNDVLSD